jgi:hypothetical protein
MVDDADRQRTPAKTEGALVALLFASIGIGAVAYGARTWMPDVASRHGAGIDAMLHYLLVSVGALFLSSYLALAWFVWRGSRRVAIGLQVGARDMAFPFLNMLSYWVALLSAVVMLASFFVEGGAAAAGWTAYPPLSAVASAVPGSHMGQTVWLLSMALFIASFTMSGSTSSPPCSARARPACR